MTICPICSTIMREHVGNSPYWRCPNCDVWAQDPAPPKIWHGDHEKGWREHGMPEDHKAANEHLAGWLFDNVMKGKPGNILDIGADWPYLASRLQARGCDAYALDGEKIEHDLPVTSIVADMEGDYFIPMPSNGLYSLITFVHSFEHLFDPVAALRKLRLLIAYDGRLFIRMPDHSVEGYERDLTPGHYLIHPFFHTLNSLLQCLVECGDCFVVEQMNELKPGQRDMVLRPIQSLGYKIGAVIGKKIDETYWPRNTGINLADLKVKE